MHHTPADTLQSLGEPVCKRLVADARHAEIDQRHVERNRSATVDTRQFDCGQSGDGGAERVSCERAAREWRWGYGERRMKRGRELRSSGTLAQAQAQPRLPVTNACVHCGHLSCACTMASNICCRAARRKKDEMSWRAGLAAVTHPAPSLSLSLGRAEWKTRLGSGNIQIPACEPAVPHKPHEAIDIPAKSRDEPESSG